MLGGCASVLIHGRPAARAGDLGLSVSCGTAMPPFQIVEGSSNVLILSSKAARQGCMTVHCQRPDPGMKTLIARGVQSGKIFGSIAARQSARKDAIDAEEAALETTTPSEAASLLAEAEGHALAAKTHTEQAARNAAAMAFQQLAGLDPGKPPCVGALITFQNNVLIGGITLPGTAQAPSLAKRLIPTIRAHNRSLQAAWILATRHKGRFSNRLPNFLRRFTGHPVDVVAGRFVLDAVDAELPGALPLRITRFYSSTWGSRPSPFGHGWSHSLDEAVWREPGQLVYRAHDGRELELPLPEDSIREIFHPLERLTIRPLPGDGWQIEDHTGILRDFHPLAREAPARLLKIHDHSGRRIDLEYADDRLVRAHTPDGREIFFNYHPSGHIARIDLPDPDTDGLVAHAHYTYEGDDLVAITDALGHVTRYRHDNHRIVEETLPDGLRFHFDYDGPDTDAACTRTRGDGGIIDHTLLYDRARRTTMVTNACKEISVVRYGPHGEPTSVTDARGATTTHEYDEHLRRTAVHAPLGRTTRHTYDDRGNLTRTIHPDGATVTVEYERDLPVAATDPAGGRWRWSYDSQRRLTRRTDPLGRTTTYHHDANTTSVTHPDGRRDTHTFNKFGLLLRLEYADGRTLEHTYDRRGRKIHTVHTDGTHESFSYDLLGRLTRHVLPDGDARNYSYDALGNLVRRCDARTDLRCTYTGLRWLASCGDANAAPYTVERDLEGRVLRIADASGTLFHGERDAAGALRRLTDARGARRLTRDLAGRVTAIASPSGTTRYTHDLADRVTDIHTSAHHDSFTYRPDGHLLTAIRRTGDATITTRRELDACGRLLREWQDDHWIALTLDVHDRITHLRSSRGADVRFHHDHAHHGPTRITAGTWSLTLERDRHGREHTRQLPGGVTAWWHRDAAGRPVEHGVTGSRPPQIHRHRRYVWNHDRLVHDLDLTTRPRARIPSTPASIIEPASSDSQTFDALGRCIALGDTRWQWHGPHLLHTIFSNDQDHTSAITWIAAYSAPAAPAEIPGAAELPTLVHTPAHRHRADEPIARLTATLRHTVVTDPSGTTLAFDEQGAPVNPLLELPAASPHLDLFGRPSDDSPALALLTAELAPELAAITR
ncbi:MAG: PAAR domain-containing protein [Myxococcales bacterium]|nr:PAAR domain-containing protein [Myxococcales bacterium]